MKLEEIKVLAKQLQIKTGNKRKNELIQAIQHAEGNEPCFGSGKAAHCSQDNCSWRNECA